MPAPDSITAAALMCHPPVIVPGVGRGREDLATSTVGAMRDAAARIVASTPDTIVLVSPHSPRRPAAFGVWDVRRVSGSFERFHAPDERVDFPTDEPFIETLLNQHDLWPIYDDAAALDHGATVPLHFIAAAGWEGPVVVVSLNQPGEGHLQKLGDAITATAAALGRRIAVVASGDMSHRLSQDAPSGFHPEAQNFDNLFVRRLSDHDPDALLDIDPDLTRLAAEDVLDPVIAVLHATRFDPSGTEVLSYEAPFGVGYGIAMLYAAPPPLDSLPNIARQAIATGLAGAEFHPPEIGRNGATFVTLRTGDGRLRGCIGTVEPREKDLGKETARNALAAATTDRRFPSVGADELPHLKIEISILSDPASVASPDFLDPATFGVILTTDDGRRGVMLPGVPTLDTVEQQLAATREKAGIGPDEPVTLQRFTVEKFTDDS